MCLDMSLSRTRTAGAGIGDCLSSLLPACLLVMVRIPKYLESDPRTLYPATLP
jgi:hypothetical protein